MRISKRIMWIISKSHREKVFFDIFAIYSSSRHEKCCQMSVRLFSLFQGSSNQQCEVIISIVSWVGKIFSQGGPYYPSKYGACSSITLKDKNSTTISK